VRRKFYRNVCARRHGGSGAAAGDEARKHQLRIRVLVVDREQPLIRVFRTRLRQREILQEVAVVAELLRLCGGRLALEVE
jgi:hypothetical protein